MANLLQDDFSTATNNGATNQENSVRSQRIKSNPLSNFSSYNYNISLYMITPDLLAEFGNFGKINLTVLDQYYIVAQSGGITSGSEPRAITNENIPGLSDGLDYYIEDLNIEMLLPSVLNSPTAISKMTFKIIEPTGFTLLNKLAYASAAINSNSNIISSTNEKPNLFQQFYMLGIRFYGYDERGDIYSTKKINLSDPSSGITNEYAYFERFFPIMFSSLQWRLVGGRSTEYEVEAVCPGSDIGFGTKFGLVKKTTTLQGKTVADVLIGNNTNKGLMQELNQNANDEQTAGLLKEKIEYEISWEKGNEIINSLLQDTLEYDSNLTPTSSARTTSQSNVGTSTKNASIDVGKRTITINKGSTILSVIDNIISRSKYITDKLLVKNNTIIESKTTKNNSALDLNWFSVVPTAIPIGRDPITKDWSYKIRYNIQKYYIPYLRLPTKAGSPAYFGPHKEYNFIFTGKNSEIINYEQSYNSQYYIITSTTTKINNTNEQSDASKIGNIPLHAHRGAVADQSQSSLNDGAERKSEFRANVASIADQGKATITILGDPDYLMQSINLFPTFESDSFNKFYGSDGFTVNPFGGQIFIEIIFNVAEDYKNDGLMDVSDKVRFYDDIEFSDVNVRGTVYRVDAVKHTFSRGKFTQDLDLTYIPLSLLDTTKIKTTSENRSESSTGSDNSRAKPASSSSQSDGNSVSQQNVETYRDYNSQPEVTDANDDAYIKPTVVNDEGGREQ